MEQISSRIDYLMVKRHHADEQSKCSHYLHDFILMAHRGNAKHSPILCSTRAQWTPWQSQIAAAGFNAKDRNTLVRE